MKLQQNVLIIPFSYLARNLYHMKKILLTAAIALLATGTYAQSAEEMKAWTDFATPGNMHKMLASYNGKWTAQTKMWMAPGQPPMESTADVVTDMYMGDRYQKSQYRGDFSGMPFEGESTIGYDNLKKVFVNTWIDNVGTGVMFSEGKWDAAKKSIEFKGLNSDPMAGKQTPFRQVLTLTNGDSYKMEMYSEMGGKEVKSMEITFTRKQ